MRKIIKQHQAHYIHDKYCSQSTPAETERERGGEMRELCQCARLLINNIQVLVYT